MTAFDPKRTLFSVNQTLSDKDMNSPRRANWKDIAELVGITAIVGSLIFVGLQMRQEQDIAVVDTFGTALESNDIALTLISAHPDIWERGLLGDELTSSDEIIFSSMVRAVWGHHIHMSIRWDRIGPGDSETIQNSFAYALYIFPGLRRVWEAEDNFVEHRNAAVERHSEGSRYIRGVRARLQYLDEAQPPVPAERRFIFWFF